jgi:MFS transporter, ACS family, D-galactonate transporter
VATGAGGSELGRSAVRRATVVLIALRVAYAYNWFDISPALLPIGATFVIGPAEFGLLTAAFLIGAGLLQVPAGFLARRFGARTVSIAGAGTLAVAGIASGLSPSFAALFGFRLLAGVGAGLFFSPAIGLVASLYPAGRRGLPVGTFSSAFSLGSAVGVLATSFLIPPIGWRYSLVLGGVLLGVLTLVAVVAIPRAAGGPPASAPPSGLPRALRYRGVWVVGLAFIGLEGASYATGQFVVPWGEVVHGWSLALAGAVGTVFVLPSLFGGPVGGPIAERFRNHRTQFVAMTLLGAGLLAALPFVGLAATIAIGIVFSFGYGFIYAVMYVLPHFWKEVPGGEIPLAIGLFNSMQLAGGAVLLAVFGWIVGRTSYAVGWEVLAVLMAATLVALVALPPTPDPGAADRPRAAAAVPSRGPDP